MRKFAHFGAVLYLYFIIEILLPIEAMGQPGASIGPSFNCARARESVAVIICGNPGLKRIDLEFVQAYQALRHQFDDTRREVLRLNAIDFHQYVIRTCEVSASPYQNQTSPQTAHCIASAYQQKREDYLRWLRIEAREEVSRDIFQHAALQKLLVHVGALPAGVVADGVYGTTTRDAIRRFQEQNNLLTNGFMTSLTAQILQSVAEQRNSQAFQPPSAPPQITDQPQSFAMQPTPQPVQVAQSKPEKSSTRDNDAVALTVAALALLFICYIMRGIFRIFVRRSPLACPKCGDKHSLEKQSSRVANKRRTRPWLFSTDSSSRVVTEYWQTKFLCLSCGKNFLYEHKERYDS